jgi:hypothetical protein
MGGVAGATPHHDQKEIADVTNREPARPRRR